MVKRKKKIGFVCSTFDLLHAGHVLYLEDAKGQCDYLIAGLQIDPTLDRPEKHKPIQTVLERFLQLKAVKYVDKIKIYHTEKELYELLKSIKPDIQILGSDHKGKKFTGDDLKIKRYFHIRNHDWSTTELRRRIKDEHNRL